ncbi:MAG: MFS transporter [Dehalococcoidia bacterium]|nr:MFS transporter [Dehalococcoidia bacterium]HRC62359.1 MFS transporter [Dehalococcoidia bacterium]
MLGTRRRNGASAAAVALPAPRPAPRFGAAFESLHMRDFRFLFFSTVSAGYAQWAQSIGIGWLAYQLTGGSALQLAAVSATGGVVRLVVSPFVGAALDRYNRRQVLVSSTLLSALQGSLLAALVVSGYAHVLHLYIFMVLDGIFSTTNQAARQAYVYDITTNETMPNAMALSAIAQNLSRISGPPLAAVMIGFMGRSSPFVVLAVLHVLAAVLTLAISRRSRQAARVSIHPLRGPLEGFVYVRREHALLGLMVIGTVPALLVYPYVQLLPVFAKDVLDGDAITFGLLAAAIGWGSIVGLLGLAFVASSVKRRGTIAIWGMVGYAIALIAFSQSTTLLAALLLLTIAGVFHGVSLNLQQMLVQMLARDDMRGRTTSLFQMGFALMPIGVLPMGAAIDRWGAAHALGAFFLVSAVVFVLMGLFWRSLREV